VGVNKSLAESEVPKFHEAFNAGKFEGIYSQSGDDLKKAATEEKFVKLVTAVHNKLGNVVELKRSHIILLSILPELL
jgi:hypothetical protein